MPEPVTTLGLCPLCGAELVGRPVVVVHGAGVAAQPDGTTEPFSVAAQVCRRHAMAHWLLASLPPRTREAATFDLFDQIVAVRRHAAGAGPISRRLPVVRSRVDREGRGRGERGKFRGKFRTWAEWLVWQALGRRYPEDTKR